MARSGVTFTSIREGVYAEAFPLFLGWYPSTEVVSLPSNGAIAYTSRAELAEATAKLMIAGGYKNEKVLLTAPKAYTFQELIDVINDASGRKVRLAFVTDDEYMALTSDDEGGKPATFFQQRISWYKGISQGDGETVDPLMEKLLGRKPQDAKDVTSGLLQKDRDYRWHQCYIDQTRVVSRH